MVLGMLRKTFLFFGGLSIVGTAIGFTVFPKVKVENLSGRNLVSFEVTLPKSKLVFENIKPSSIHVATHSPFQNDGVYEYIVQFESGAQLTGQCGYISSGGFGSSFLFTVRSGSEVTCNS